ncbi:hypothetical protein GCM10008018_13360 [Paenibacillus marchantiophytorum]|uniref:Uncharacterized protein n=1 Tax=Paenibacillus marchantiophytorum TaxID=1619310 RepID=A0ABQ2BTE4_9BACL|nr:hypothetical protein [Paenibacillus marchantiophytorum]GGI45678.1 hypothetical protein GCM10008018_13360 [Paenibacillus marchantiophytorum]
MKKILIIGLLSLAVMGTSAYASESTSQLPTNEVTIAPPSTSINDQEVQPLALASAVKAVAQAAKAVGNAAQKAYVYGTEAAKHYAPEVLGNLSDAFGATNDKLVQEGTDIIFDK